MANVKILMLQRISDKATHNSEYYTGMVDFAVICRVTACFHFVHGYDHRCFDRGGKARYSVGRLKILPIKLRYSLHLVERQPELMNWVQSGNQFRFLPTAWKKYDF